MIPAEAVEAAARKFFSKWDELPASSKEHFYPDIRAMLEAAAPYMLAGAWDEGYTLGYADCANKQESNRPNPYMLNNEGEK